jgi:hypothetical protein
MKVKTMRGEMLDMGLLAAQNERAIALGNAKMNARGDIITSTGEIVKSREALSQEYHRAPKKAVRQVSLRDISNEVFQTPSEAVATLTAPKKEKVEASVAEAPAPKATKRKIEDRD